MKKTTISMLITALILFCSGLLLTLGTLIYTTAASVDIYPGQSMEPSNFRDFTKSFADLGYTRENPVKRIEISTLVGDVQVIPTNGESKAEFKDADINNITCKMEGSTLVVRENNAVGFMGVQVSNQGFSFNGLRQIFHSAGNASPSHKLILHLNPLEFNGVLTIKNAVGTISVQNIACAEMSVSADYGKIFLADCNLVTTLDANGNMAELVLRNNTCQQLNANVTLGNIYALVNENKVNLKASMGNITVLTQKDQSNYQLRLFNTIGSIRPYDIENNKNEFSLFSESDNSIWVNTMLGNITVSKFDAQSFPQKNFTFEGDLVKVY